MGSAGMYRERQKCGRVNVLGQAQMIKAYAETYGYHM